MTNLIPRLGEDFVSESVSTASLTTWVELVLHGETDTSRINLPAIWNDSANVRWAIEMLDDYSGAMEYVGLTLEKLELMRRLSTTHRIEDRVKCFGLETKRTKDLVDFTDLGLRLVEGAPRMSEDYFSSAAPVLYKYMQPGKNLPVPYWFLSRENMLPLRTMAAFALAKQGPGKYRHEVKNFLAGFAGGGKRVSKDYLHRREVVKEICGKL